MHRTSLLIFSGILTLGLSACNGSPGGGEPTAEVVSPVPVETAPAEQVPFSEPTVTAQASPTGLLPPDLISSTDPNQRVRAIQSNRPDPFALVQTTPTVQIPVEERTAAAPQAPQSVPVLPNFSQTLGGGSSAPGGNTPATAALPPGATNQLPRPGTAPAAVPPPRPQPTLARAVKVTGVVQVGNTLHAIVNAPNEPTSRYVQVGQRLSNGQVLVKRIEMNGSSTPVVILEQNGIEVATGVGEGGSPQEVPTAAVPVNQTVASQPMTF
jgi:hypothetical protein